MPNQNQPYSDADCDYLRQHYRTAPKAAILAHFPDRTWSGLTNMASKLNACGRPNVGPLDLRPVWNTARLAYLRQHYPAQGGNLATALGLTPHQVRQKAHLMGLTYDITLAQSERPTPAPYRRPHRATAPPKPAPAPAPAPKVAAPAPVPAPVRRTVCAIPVAVASKKARQAAEKHRAPVTAEQIRRLDYNAPERIAYTRNGVAGWQQWKASQPTC